MKRQHSRKYWHKTALIDSKGVPQTFFFAQMGSADIFHHQNGSAHRKWLGNTALGKTKMTNYLLKLCYLLLGKGLAFKIQLVRL